MPKAPKVAPLLNEAEQTERVREVVNRLLGHSPGNALAPSLDTSRPNIHDNKAEFQAELERVKGALDAVFSIFDKVGGRGVDADAKLPAIFRRFQSAIDKSGRLNAASIKPDDALDLIRINVADVGLAPVTAQAKAAWCSAPPPVLGRA